MEGAKNKEEMMASMDAAAVVAETELRAMAQKDSIPVARWFAAHYKKAGHKRLGRALVSFAKDVEGLMPENYGGEG
jgi:hypothetical protein